MEDEKIERLRERILQCPICMDEYKDPRILPCHHTVCLQCLLDFVRHSSSSGRLFRCPQCRADIYVPRGGVKDFPPNFYVNCIQDELGSRPYFGVCDICERDWLVSQYRCVDCDQDICRFCIHEHRLFKHSSGRQVTIMRIETGNIGTQLASQKSCQEHTDESLHMYCTTCEKAVCVTCVCEHHKQHNTIPLMKKLSQSQKQLQMELDQLNADATLVQKSLTDLQNLRDSIHKKSEENVTAVRKQARELTLEIDRIADEKVARIQDTERKCFQDMDAYSKELQSYSDEVLKGSSFLEDLQEGDVSLELFACFEKYRKSVDLLRKSVLNKTIKHEEMDFLPGKLIQKLGYQLIKFGGFKCEKISSVFMPVRENNTLTFFSKVQPKWRIRIQNGVLLLFALLSLMSLGIITSHLMDSTEHFMDILVGFTFVLLLTIASICAYMKSTANDSLNELTYEQVPNISDDNS